MWRRTASLPAGSYAYKAAIDGSWDENYGAGGAPGGADIPLVLDAPQDVTFYYDHASHWITSDAEGPIVTLAGSMQSELGCASDWSPDCMRGWLKDPDGDGTYTFATTALPAGSYETKVAHGLSWAENYGADGTLDGGNIGFDVPAAGVEVVFSYDVSSHRLTISSRAAGAAPDLTLAKAHWVRDDLVAWDVPDADSRTPPPALVHGRRPGRRRRGGHRGLQRAAAARPGRAAGRRARRLPAARGLRGVPARPGGRRGRCAEILTGQLAVASYATDGTLRDATGVQVPGVLDDVYADAADRELGVTWQGRRPTLSLWAPTAQSVAALVGDRRVPDGRGSRTARGPSAGRRPGRGRPTPTRSWSGRPTPRRSSPTG